MNLHDVLSTGPLYEKLRRVGRGLGSGMGKTSTRGQKGHGSRQSFHGKLGFEGGQMPLYRRLPKRGFTNGRFRTDYNVLNVAQLEKSFNDGEEVTLEAIRTKGLLAGGPGRLKILAEGAITKKLTVKAHAFSAAAAQKIEAAGGKLERLS